MAERPDFQQRQYAFAAHIRDPQHAPRPDDVDERHMGIYRELFFNNLDGFLRDTLPVLHGLLAAAHWDALVRDFLVKHRAHSPYFLDIPREFLRYLEHERDAHPAEHFAGHFPGQFRNPPFLYELAHYEWVELALSVHEADIDLAGIDRDGDLLAGHPLLSPLAWPLQYRFPVQHIRPDYQPTAAPASPTQLLVYRDAEDTVRFLELNPVSARLLGLLAEHADAPAYSGRQALETVARELQHPQPEQIITHGLELLQDWRARGIVLGAAR
ncbi:MAG: putative DNA-binding domain-containing protein [Gammaproteobacteria bacterium]|nr:putative DNA-binding domain-containing protein [Gammaproteobacteria bacterium]